MQGDQMIGRIDTKRDGDMTIVTAFWPERSVRMGKARISALQSEIERVATFVGSDDVIWAKDWLKENT